MIIDVGITRYLRNVLVGTYFKSVEVTSSWYTPQVYFNEELKEDFLNSEEYDAIVMKWQNKNYVFKRK
jgi:hypothetical protein